MGTLESKPIKECTKEDISLAVASLGEPYQVYASTLNGNAVDGRLLDVLGTTEIEETLDDLDIANRLHRRVLLLELNKAKSGGEYVAAAYNYSPSTPQPDLKPFQQITDKCLRENKQTAVFAGVYLVLENGNQLSLDTKILKDGIIVTETLNSPRSPSICSIIVNDDCNPDYNKLPFPNEMQSFLFGDSALPTTLTGYIFRDETGKRQGIVCMLDRCSPSDIVDADRKAFLRPLALEVESILRLRKQLLEQRSTQQFPNTKECFQKLGEKRESEIVLSAYGPIQPVLQSQVKKRLSQVNPFQFAPGERASHKLPIFQNMSTEDDTKHLPLDYFDLADEICSPRTPIAKNDMECSAIVEALALTEINPDEPIAIYLKEMVKMATQVFGFPNAEITFRNHDTIFCMAGYGLNEEIKKCANVFPTMKRNKDGSRFLWQMPRALAVCNYVMASASTFVLQDIAADESFQWLISGTPCRCYVGTAIKDSCGRAIAVLCMHDARPRPDFEAAHEIQLEQMARIISQSIENWALKRSIEHLERERKTLNRKQDKQLPPKTKVYFVITDIEGCVDMWEANSAAMQSGQHLHDNIITGLCAKNFGHIVEMEGNSFTLAFHDPVDAFRFALQAQMELYEANWPDDLLCLPHAKEETGAFRGLRVKMAIHHGSLEPSLGEEKGPVNYTGETMGITRNVLLLANGGQILSTAETWDVASYVIGSMLAFPQVLDHGSHVICKGQTTRDGIITKRIIQLVPSKLAYDYFTARKLSPVPEQERHHAVLSTHIPGRHFPPISSLKKVSPSFHDAPFIDNEVTMAFVNLSAVDEQSASMVVNLIGILLDGMPEFGGYQCQNEMLAFHRPLDAILFGLFLRKEIAVREPLQDGSNVSQVAKLVTFACIHEPFLTMGPHRTTGRADYFGKIVNRAARLSKAVTLGSVCFGVVCGEGGDAETRCNLIHHPSLRCRFSGKKRLKGIPEEVSVFEYGSNNVEQYDQHTG
jgi:class 3 adenylate cyclase